MQRRDTYVTAADFELVASAGINAVRLPVGYWALGTTTDEAAPFVPGAWAYVDAALDWGFRTGIGDLWFRPPTTALIMMQLLGNYHVHPCGQVETSSRCAKTRWRQPRGWSCTLPN